MAAAGQERKRASRKKKQCNRLDCRLMRDIIGRNPSTRDGAKTKDIIESAPEEVLPRSFA
jgi:hypothetical protein